MAKITYLRIVVFRESFKLERRAIFGWDKIFKSSEIFSSSANQSVRAQHLFCDQTFPVSVTLVRGHDLNVCSGTVRKSWYVISSCLLGPSLTFLWCFPSPWNSLPTNTSAVAQCPNLLLHNLFSKDVSSLPMNSFSWLPNLISKEWIFPLGGVWVMRDSKSRTVKAGQ